MSFRSPWLLISVLAFAGDSAFAQAQRPARLTTPRCAMSRKGKGEEWLSYGFTPQETRYTPLSQINTSNVSRLGLAWSYEVGPGGGGQEATPLVHNGVIFSTTQWSVVFAVDARTGKEKWRWDPEVNQTALRSKICCGVVQRGIAMYDGKIIAPAIDGRLFASGRRDGQARVGSARRLPSGQLHHHDGPAHRQRQGDHRRIRRGVSCARLHCGL